VSVRATGAVWQHSKLKRSDGAFRLLLAIADRASDDGIAWPSPAELEERVGVSERHLRRCVAAAIAAGELDRRETTDGTTVYRLVLEGLETPDGARLERRGLRLTEPFAPDTHVRKRRTRMSAPADAHVRPRARQEKLQPSVQPSGSASGGSAPNGATAQDLVAFYVDETRRQGAEPLKRLIGHVGREVKQLLEEGVPADEVRAGLRVVVSKGLHPSALASCVNEYRTRRPRKRGGASERFAQYDV
jgi:hypothetical protein